MMPVSVIRNLLSVLIWIGLAGLAPGATFQVLETPDVTVLYDSSAASGAPEIPGLYLEVSGELGETLGLHLSYRPAVLLTEGADRDRSPGETFHFVAYARPAEGLVVLLLHRMRAASLPLSPVLKHELCHLILHDAMEHGNLPRWLDEGVAQWVSGGISEMAAPRRPYFLPGAVLTGRDVPLDRLDPFFRGQERDIRYAYEKSRSVIEFLVKRGGSENLSSLLKEMARGETVSEAFRSVYGMSLEDFENLWRRHMKGFTGWLFYLSRYLYEFLFFLGAIVAFVGFLRYRRKIKAWREREDLEEGEDDETFG